MQYHTDDVRITGMQEVIAPETLMQTIPITDKASSDVFRTRAEAADIIGGGIYLFMLMNVF